MKSGAGDVSACRGAESEIPGFRDSLVCDRIVKLVFGDVGFGILKRLLSEENEKREKCETTRG